MRKSKRPRSGSDTRSACWPNRSGVCRDTIFLGPVIGAGGRPGSHHKPLRSLRHAPPFLRAVPRCPGCDGAEFAKVPTQTILGASLTVTAPIGQYYPEKVINLGANRWAFKPEIAVSQPLGDQWLFDLYAAVWLFTANDSYYPGNANRTQDPLTTFQAHVSYTLIRQMWVAIDVTYYIGGLSYVNGSSMDDRQNNSRIGGTLVLPVGDRHSVKLSGSTGAIIRLVQTLPPWPWDGRRFSDRRTVVSADR